MIFAPQIVGWLGLAGLLALIVARVPIGVALAIVGSLGTAAIIGVEPALALLAIEPSAAIASEGLAVLAMFLLMGNLAHVSGISAELYALAAAFIGHRRGGLALATVATSAGFGALSGSSVATTATMVRIALPEMLQRGYARTLATGSIASGGTLGMIVPPSLVMILYAILTENSIIALFLAAIIPALLAVVFYAVTVVITTRLNPSLAPRAERANWTKRRGVLRQSWAAVLLGATVGIGIYSGLLTVVEAAAVGASMALLIALVRRRLGGGKFIDALRETAKGTGMIFVILIGAGLFTYFASLSGLPEAALSGIQSLGLSPAMVIVALLVFYIFLGAVFDTIAAMVLTLPIVYPLVIGMGFDPLWWGVINVVVIELGMITPPFGINVFVLHGMQEGTPLRTIFKGVMPFVVADVLRLALLASVPVISLWLPRAMGW